MSGGSYDYLYARSGYEMLERTEDLMRMADRLRTLGPLGAAAHAATQALLDRVRTLEVELHTAVTDLSRVWKAAEWVDSADWADRDLADAVTDYAAHHGLPGPAGPAADPHPADRSRCQRHCPPPPPPSSPGNRVPHPPRPIPVEYRNHRGDVGPRRILPLGLRYGDTEHHGRPQWLLEVFDLDRHAPRTYALADCTGFGYAPIEDHAFTPGTGDLDEPGPEHPGWCQARWANGQQCGHTAPDHLTGPHRAPPAVGATPEQP